MYSYGLKIKKGALLVSLTSPNSTLIEEEYTKVAADFLGITLDEIMETKRTLVFDKSVSTEEILQEESAIDIPQEIVPLQEDTILENDTNEEESVIEQIEEPEKPKRTRKTKKATAETTTEDKPKKAKKTKKLPSNFAALLAEKEQTSENNVIEKKDSELKNTYFQMQALIKEKNLKDEVDFIVAAAYCLTRYENVLRFTEEQIFAKVMPFSNKKIEHNYILDAVAKNLIKVLPDFTGVSDTLEYELTEQGEDYFLNEL